MKHKYLLKRSEACSRIRDHHNEVVKVRHASSKRFLRYIYLLYTYQDLRANGKNTLPAYQRIDALIGYIIFTREQNHVARSPPLLTDK